MERYDRQIRVKKIGPCGQEKIAQVHVLIVGCGALGSYTAEQLLRMGIKKMTLLDFDYVELSNLQRQTLFTEADATNNVAKVEAAKNALTKIDSSAKIFAYKESFSDYILQEESCPDLILDCSDNYQVREEINNYCHYYKIPFVFAALAATSGQVMAINPVDAPCLGCALPQLDALIQKDCDLLGVITPLVPMISSYQVSLALKIITNPKEVIWDEMLYIDAWSYQLQNFKVKKQAHCKYCQKTELKNAPQNFMIKKMCGQNVFSTQIPAATFFLIDHFCQKQQLPLKKNPLAARFTWDDYEFTLFPNGRLHFYGFTTSKSIQPYLDNLVKGALIAHES